MDTDTSAVEIDIDSAVDANLDALDALDACTQLDAEQAIDDAQDAYDGPYGAEIEALTAQINAILAGYEDPAALADLTAQLRDYLTEHAHAVTQVPMFCDHCCRERTSACWRFDCPLWL